MNNKKFKFNAKLLTISLIIVLISTISNTYGVESELIGGKNRIETSIMIAERNSINNTIILSSGENDKLIDSLVFAPLSTKLNAPILLNTGKKLSIEVSEYVNRHKINNVIIAGGSSSISSEVEKELKDKSIKIRRIAGKDRFETSEKVKNELGEIKGIFLVGKDSIADAVSVSSIAGIKNHAILIYRDLNNSNLEKYKKIYIIGGTSSVNSEYLSKKNYKRLSGSNRYLTNLAIIKEFINEFTKNNVVITSGEDKYLVDGLVAGPYATKIKAPIIFDQAVYKDYLNNISVNDIKTIFIGNRVKYNGIKNSIEILNEKTKSKNISRLNFDTKKKKEVKVEATTGLPQIYDLRDVNGKSYLTNIKNQYYDGGCRSFASIAALESHIMLKNNEELDLSENNMETRHDFTFKNSGIKLKVREGRNSLSDLSYLISGKGPIMETDDPYVPIKHDLTPAPYLSDDQKNSILKDNEKYKTRFKIEEEARNPIKKPAVKSVLGFEFLKDIDTKAIISPEDITMKQIKEAIKNNGPVVSNIYMAHDNMGTFPYSNATNYNHEKAAYYSSDYKENSNHAIAIVGWDDTFSKDNFKEGNRPDIDGAWIVRDSQTENFGDKGYFYVSFKSNKICTDAYVFTNVKSPEEFKGVYQHDEIGLSGFIKHDQYGEKSPLFNRYIVNDNNQNLDSIGFYTTKPHAEYEIYLTYNFDSFRKEFDSKEFETIDEINEELKNIKILSGTMDKAGYHTLKIPDQYLNTIKKGDKLGLGIYVKNLETEDEKHEWDMPVEINVTSNPNKNHGEKAIINPNETFTISNFISDYYEFADISKNDKINACIKLYYK